jgi:hypothetical protein
MKNLLVLVSLLLVNPCFAGRLTLKKNRRKNKLVEKTTHKELVKNHQTGVVALVDATGSCAEHVGSYDKMLRPDWKRLIANQSQTIDSRDPEIELTNIINPHSHTRDLHEPSQFQSSVDWNALAAYVCQPGRVAQVIHK